jgi:hypothetical protein
MVQMTRLGLCLAAVSLALVGLCGPALALEPAEVIVTINYDDPVTTSPSVWLQISASDGANLGTFASRSGPAAVAYDGANVWVANHWNTSVTKW